MPGVDGRAGGVMPLALDAPAKLNLSLRVVGRRPGGMHLLESDLVLLEMADRLVLRPGEPGLQLDGPEARGLPATPDNLAWRGLLAGLEGEPTAMTLTLDKRVPVGAGLGGGSSDAAAAWRLARSSRGRDVPPSEPELGALGEIGADVPFFAAAVVAARVTGIGERVEGRAVVSQHVVLVHPGFTLATRAVFAELRADDWGRATNDLLAPARRLRPELDDLFDLVRRSGGDPALTGSGSTIFSLTDDPDRATAVADALTSAGARATITRTRATPATIERLGQEEKP